MYDLRYKSVKENKNRFDFFKKFKFKYLFFLILISILLFPKQSGSLIGNWIYDFFITIIDIIKQ